MRKSFAFILRYFGGNTRDAALKNRMAKGSANGRAKLTETDAIIIRALAGTMLHREIAALFDVSKALVSNIIQRKNWTHV